MLGIGQHIFCGGFGRRLLDAWLAIQIGLFGSHKIHRPMPTLCGARAGCIGLIAGGSRHIPQKLFDQVNSYLASHSPSAHNRPAAARSQQVGRRKKEIVAWLCGQFREAASHRRLHARQHDTLRPLVRSRNPFSKRGAPLGTAAANERAGGHGPFAEEFVEHNQRIAQPTDQAGRHARYVRG